MTKYGHQSGFIPSDTMKDRKRSGQTDITDNHSSDIKEHDSTLKRNEVNLPSLSRYV